MSQVLQEFPSILVAQNRIGKAALHPPGCHRYSAFPPIKFAEMMHTALELAIPIGVDHIHHRYFEIGCGPGILLRLLQHMTRNDTPHVCIEACEVDPELADIARLWTGCRVHTKDAADIDYGLYSLIYIYTPYRNDLHNRMLLNKITNEVRSGTTVVWVGLDDRLTSLSLLRCIYTGDTYYIMQKE